MYYELKWLGVVLAVLGALIVAALAYWVVRQAVLRRANPNGTAQIDYSRRLNPDDDGSS